MNASMQLRFKPAAQPLLSVVVPVYNERAVLPLLHARLTAGLSGLPLRYEIVLVDDGSRDGSDIDMADLAARVPHVRAVRLSRNFGKEAALTAGIAHTKGDAVVVLDADLQDPPELIPQMIEAWQAGADVVAMRRRTRAGETATKKLSAHLFYRLLNRVSAVDIPDDTGDFRLMSRKAVDALGQLPERNRYMKGLFAWIGLPTTVLLYDRAPRAAGQTKWDYLGLLRLAFEGITSFSVAPLRIELAQEREFFVAQGFDPAKALVLQGPGITRVYYPAGQGATNAANELPAVFAGLSPGFMGEVYRDEQTYLVSISNVSGGTLYLARDITHFEEREWLFRMAILVVGLLVGLLVIALSVVGARRVVQPLRELAERIQRLPVGPAIDRLPGHWQDAELQTIAGAFNDFVTELEAYVRREKSLLALASHELRTPIAIITGALDILEQRGGLSAADQATLVRIRRAADEMQSNVRVLLALARKNKAADSLPASVSLATEIHVVLEGLAVDFPIASRVSFNASGPGQVCADPVVVRMLLRNLIQNALQHTTRRIYIALHEDVVEVRDEGPGLNPVAQDILQGTLDLASDNGPVSGLGLYLVTLMVERLGWRLDLAQTTSSGTTIRVGPRDSAFFSDQAVNEKHDNGANN